MPRTIESILECHRVAEGRRRQGRPIWDLTLPLKDILKEYEQYGDDLSVEKAVELSHRIGAMLKAAVPAAWRTPEHRNFHFDYEDMFERFAQADAGDFTKTKDFNEDPCEVINEWLDELYDWGDRCRVFMR